jgi:hypothetical protein
MHQVETARGPLLTAGHRMLNYSSMRLHDHDEGTRTYNCTMNSFPADPKVTHEASWQTSGVGIFPAPAHRSTARQVKVGTVWVSDRARASGKLNTLKPHRQYRPSPPPSPLMSFRSLGRRATKENVQVPLMTEPFVTLAHPRLVILDARPSLRLTILQELAQKHSDATEVKAQSS